MIRRLRSVAFAQARKAYYRLVEKSLFRRSREQTSSRFFPICHGRNYFYHPLDLANAAGRRWFAKFHQESAVNPFAIDFGRFTAELVEGERVAPHTEWRANLDRPSAVPLAVEAADRTRALGNFAVDVVTGGQTRRLNGLVGERFHYLPLDKAGPVTLRSDNPLIVGRPLPLTQVKPHRHRLVLALFVDALTTEIFKEVPIERAMPNLARFFAEGAVFENCHATSEWTLPSVPSIMSGRRTRDHGMFHPARDTVIGDGHAFLPERFQADDYLTFITIPGGRMAPAYGYPRGFDRSLYRLYMPMHESLSAAYDHLRAFPNRDHFMWLGIMEAHHTLLHAPDISTQIGGGLEGLDFAARAEERNMKRRRDEASVRRYLAELARIDFHLGQMLDHVQRSYGEDEFLVALFADHGVKFLETTPHFLPPSVTRVPFMLRGGGVPKGRFDELIQTLDIAPALLHLVGLPALEGGDGRVPHALGGPVPRDFVMAESLYPRRPYHAVVHDRDWEFHLRSGGLIDDAGTFALGQADMALYAAGKRDRDVLGEHPRLVEHFMKLLGLSG